MTISLRGDLRLEPGYRFRVWLPAADGDAFGPEAFRVGQGFTVWAGELVWRGILVYAEVAGDGSGAELAVELADRTPVAYGRPPANPAPVSS